MRVPTPSGFATMKLMAWFDRHTPRDLYDLTALADAGHIDRNAVNLVRSLAGYIPSAGTLDRQTPRSVESSWQAELGHQASNLISADDCLARVRRALDQLDAKEDLLEDFRARTATERPQRTAPS